MDAMTHLLGGLAIALAPTNLLFCFIGVFIGTLIGVLPGIGPTGTIAILLPLTFGIPPTTAMIMLCGIYYGAQYGSSTTAILINCPGETSSVVTCLDGYRMALKGRAGAALGIAAIGSFIAGTISTIGLMLLAPPLARAALKLGPPEYFLVMILGLTVITQLGGQPLKALIMGTLGLVASLVGSDPMTGTVRFAYGTIYLLDGIYIIPVVMGLFALSEVIVNMESMEDVAERVDFKYKRLKELLPTAQDWRDSTGPILRGSALGFFVGILPGAGAAVSSFVSYAVERKISKHPERFGEGTIEGVAGPESANNAGVGGAMVPLLALGIPGNAITAMLAAALMIFGLQFGPLLFRSKPDLIWGVIASMYVGNAMLLILNLPLIKIWVKIIEIPNYILYPLIVVFIYVGTIASKGNIFDLWLTLAFGLLGYLGKHFGYPPAPFVLAFILGDMIEKNLRRAMALGRGNIGIFFERPLCIIILGIVLLILLYPVFGWFHKRMRKKA
jgi:putative tricarboxylic transport membrane protein